MDNVELQELVNDVLMLDAEEEIIVGHMLMQMFRNPLLMRPITRRQEVMTVDISYWRNLGDRTFHAHFRMTRGVFEKLVVAVGSHLESKNRIHFLRTPLDVALMMALWILVTPDTFRSAGNQFGVSKGVIFFHYIYITFALREMSAIYVKWPSPLERYTIRRRFEDRNGYPGVCGCIDVCHIRIIAPHIHPQRYVNRHHDHSIAIQAVCDHNLQYRDIYVGEPGSVGDVRTFEKSPLCNNMYNREGYLNFGEHLIGDGIYPISQKLMVPYPNNGRMTNRQRAHNVQLSGARSSIERSFALLRGKMRRLKHLSSYSPVIAVNHIMASMVLHNFIILRGELPGLPCEEDFLPDVEDIVEGVDLHNVVQQEKGPGAIERELIAEMLYPLDN